MFHRSLSFGFVYIYTFSDRSVVRVQDLREPMMIVKKNNHLFGALFPNHF